MTGENRILRIATDRAPAAGPLAERTGVIDSHRLLDAQHRLIIRHNGEHYQLRQTKSGKLILTK